LALTVEPPVAVLDLEHNGNGTPALVAEHWLAQVLLYLFHHRQLELTPITEELKVIATPQPVQFIH